MHNLLAAKISALPVTEIDKINKEVDAPSQVYGPHHRFLYHSMNADAPDSREINRGRGDYERVRKIHILIDTNPRLNRIAKLLELREQQRKIIKKKYPVFVSRRVLR